MASLKKITQRYNKTTKTVTIMSYLQLHAVLIFTSFHKVNPLLLSINILTTPIKPGRFLQMDQQVVVVCRC